jgi:tRNA A37 threonylcarbamoyladenosine biosynthesis protein TsaE
LNIIEWPEKNPQFWEKEKYIQLKLVKQNSETRLITLTIPFSINDLQKTKITDFFSSLSPIN